MFNRSGQATMNPFKRIKRNLYIGAPLVRGLRHGPVQKPIASVLLLTLLSMFTLQAQAAVQQYLHSPVSVAPAVHIANLSDALKDLHESLHRTQRNATLQDKQQAGVGGFFTKLKNLASRNGPDETRHLGALDLIQREAKISALENQTRKDFAATLDHLQKAHLPATILQRHAAAVKQFEDRSKILHGKLAALRDADGKDDSTLRQTALNDIDSTLSQWEPKARQVDPKHLPWGSPSNKVRAPYKSKDDYLQHLSMFDIKPIQLAYNGSGAMPPGTVWPTLPTMGEAVQAADTQATEDVQITPEIQALANQLGNNPVKIYQWVHDNIRYIPTYGSIQGSDYTYQLQAGNDFDTASLLIALLRASNIPARYVYGTINVPVAQVENWVGGVNNVDAALNLLGQGGVPSEGITQGGQVAQIQMEHVWVEAYVSYFPSRGWVNNGKGDAWVPLDASYKQYTYTAPTISLQQAAPFNTQQFVTDALGGATVAPDGSYVQNLNQAAVQSDVNTYQSQAQSYLGQQQPNATVGSYLGTQTINTYPAKVLPQSLPYVLVAAAADVDILPNTMRHYLSYIFYGNGADLGSDSPDIKQTLSLPGLAGRALALSFRPATSADKAMIDSYLPSPNPDGSAVDPGSIPQSLPGYLINLIPELTLNGQIIESGSNPIVMGSEVFASTSILSPNLSLNGVVSNSNNIAGNYIAIGVDGQGVSINQLTALQQKSVSVQQQLNGKQAAGLDKHSLLGTVLQTGVSAYFAATDSQSQIAVNASGVIAARLPSFGTFYSSLAVEDSYGAPVNVSPGGVIMDMEHMASAVVDKNNNANNAKSYQLIDGSLMSLNENMIPEKLLGSSGRPISGVSAVKALEVASSLGQKIFTINSENIQAILPGLSLGNDVISDIENSVASGYEVTVGQSSISYAGWTGAGYIIMDPVTGTAAYKISGGQNGGAVTGQQLEASLGGALVSLFMFFLGFSVANADEGGGNGGESGGGFLNPDVAIILTLLAFFIGIFTAIPAVIAVLVISILLLVDQVRSLEAYGSCADTEVDVAIGFGVFAIVAGLLLLFAGPEVALGAAAVLLIVGLLLGSVLDGMARFSCQMQGGGG